MVVELLGVSDDWPLPSELPDLAPETAARVRASVARQTLLSTLGVNIERLAPGYVELRLASSTDSFTLAPLPRSPTPPAATPPTPGFPRIATSSRLTSR